MAPQFDKAFELINQMAREMGMPSIFGGASRNKSSYLYWDPPKDWNGTLYQFAYTPWKTKDPETQKTGYWTLKYRYLKKKKQWKLVKKVRFGRRKIAHKRALEWYAKHYGQTP